MRTLITIFLATATVAVAMAGDDAPGLQYGMPGEWPAVSDTVISAKVAENSGCVEKWWTVFDDSLLDSLIELGTSNNYDVAMATRRLAIAKAEVGTARAAYYPTLNVAGSYNRARNAGAMNSPMTSSATTSYWGAEAQASWEPDVFGRVRASVDAAKNSVRVSAADRAGVILSMQAQIALTYIELRVQQAELNVAHEHSARQLKALKIAEARFETGITSMMDVDQARQVYYSTIASVPMLESNIHNNITALCTLVGEASDALRNTLAISRPIPVYIQLVQSGVPADLLRNRPDVAAAERQIDVYASQLGIAKKEWLPSLSFDASAGTYAHDGKNLFKGKSLGYTVSGTISWTVFDGLARKYAVTSAKEQLRNAVDNYNLTVLTAMQEADNALATYYSTLKYISALNDVVDAAKQYDIRSLENYKSGLAPYINVANAQMSFLEDINTLIVAKGNALSALINLYKALGGGWSSVTDK